MSPVCKCGRPLQINFQTGKYFVRCPPCRVAYDQLRKHPKHPREPKTYQREAS